MHDPGFFQQLVEAELKKIPFNFSPAELYDPISNSWTAAPEMASVHSGHAAASLPDGGVLVTGGRDEHGPVSNIERYDPARNLWAPAGTLSDARWQHTTTLLPGGKILAIGGKSVTDSALATVEQYDPGTNSWAADH